MRTYWLVATDDEAQRFFSKARVQARNPFTGDMSMIDSLEDIDEAALKAAACGTSEGDDELFYGDESILANVQPLTSGWEGDDFSRSVWAFSPEHLTELANGEAASIRALWRERLGDAEEDTERVTLARVETLQRHARDAIARGALLWRFGLVGDNQRPPVAPVSYGTIALESGPSVGLELGDDRAAPKSDPYGMIDLDD